jgi:hypothetical protein
MHFFYDGGGNALNSADISISNTHCPLDAVSNSQGSPGVYFGCTSMPGAVEGQLRYIRPDSVSSLLSPDASSTNLREPSPSNASIGSILSLTMRESTKGAVCTSSGKLGYFDTVNYGGNTNLQILISNLQNQERNSITPKSVKYVSKSVLNTVAVTFETSANVFKVGTFRFITINNVINPVVFKYISDT